MNKEGMASLTRWRRASWLYFLPPGAALLGQVFLLFHHGQIHFYRGIAFAIGVASLLWGFSLLKGKKPLLLTRCLLAVATSALVWLTLLEILLAHATILARGFLLIVTAFCVHATLLVFTTRSRSEDGLPSRMVLRLGVMLSVVFFLLFSTECVFRAIIPLRLHEIVPDDPRDRPFLVMNEKDRPVARPGYKGEYRHPEFLGLRVVINGYGLRDGLDEASPPAPGEASILVLGDSFAFGTGVTLEETFQELLEARHKEIVCRPLRVYGTGMPGYGQVQELKTLEELAPITHPDIVIVALYEGNDFTDNMAAQAREAGLIHESRDEKKRDPLWEPVLARYLRGVTRFPFWIGSCALFKMVLPAIESSLVRLGLIRPFVPSNYFLTRSLMINPPDYVRIGRKRTIGLIAKIEDRCDAIEADLVVLVIPAKIQAIPQAFENFLSARAPETRHQFHRTVFHEALIKELREKNFLVVDMLRFLEEESLSGIACYHREGHLNAKGHALISDLLAPVLCELFTHRER